MPLTYSSLHFQKSSMIRFKDNLCLQLRGRRLDRKAWTLRELRKPFSPLLVFLRDYEMFSVFLLRLFLFSQAIVLHSAEGEVHAQECSPFYCGKLGKVHFSFTHRGQLDCGFFEIGGYKEKVQEIKLEKGGKKWYDILNIAQDNTMTIIDRNFAEHLKSRSCEAFMKNITLPDPSVYPDISLTLSIKPNITLLVCDRSLNLSVYTNLRNTYIKICQNYSIYYYATSKHNSSASYPGCFLVQLPSVKELHHKEEPDDLISLLTDRFNIEVKERFDCIKCIKKNSECKVTDEGRFFCPHRQEDKQLQLKLGIGLGLGIPATVLIGFIILYYSKLKSASSHFQPTNTNSDPSSTSDLEQGSICFGVPLFSYCELEEATNNFDTGRELGDGGFGTVYHGKLKDGREVAVKRLYEHNYKRVQQFINEVLILTRLRHQNLVSLYGCTSRQSRELLLVYEYIPNGTVADHLHGNQAKPGSLPWSIRMKIAIETASALVYLHASDIVHRDVKTNNILLDNNFCIKVADFGLSRLFPTDVTHVSTAPQGTPGYVDPEYHQCYQLTSKSDVYSFGVVLAELLSSMPAVDITRHRQEINLANLALNKIQRSAFAELVDPSLGFESDTEVRRMTISVAELAYQCLQQDKEMRPSMDEVLEALTEIQNGIYEPQKQCISHDHQDGLLSSTKPPPPPSPECDEVGLLKNIKLPPSPISVNSKWDSKSTTSNATVVSSYL